MGQRLKGQVALVTGGGRGIGRAVALQYAKEGAAVAVTSRTEGQVDETVETIRRAGGTAIGILQAPIIMDLLLYGKDAQGVLYDPQKFSWLGSFDQFTPIAVVWNTLGVKTIDQAKGREIKFGSSGGDVSERLYANILNTMLGTNFVAVAGYSGSAEIALAMERGEVPAFVGWYWAGMKRTKPEWLEKNLITARGRP